MEKRDKKNIAIFMLLIIYIIIYKLFIMSRLQEHAEIITACFLIILSTITFMLLGYRKDKNTVIKKVILKNTIFYIVITFAIIYGLGFFTGFLKNAYSLKISKIFDNILGPIFIVVLTEMLRYLIISANKDKKYPIYILTFILIVFESVITVKTGWTSNANICFKTITSTILPIILKNIVLSYLCKETGMRSPLAYRCVLDLYYYILPVFPNLGDYLNSMILISLPILIYIHSSNIIDEYKNGIQHDFRVKQFKIYDLPVLLIIVILIALISGYFDYYMIGIGSESMSPVINKGDAVIIKKVKLQKELKEGEIIVYQKDKQLIIHRLIKIEKKDGKLYYRTKGDANSTEDNIKIKKKDIKGIVKIKIPVIAYPSVFLKEQLS